MNISNRRQQLERFENMVFTSFSTPTGAELPQVTDDHDLIIELLQDITMLPHEVIDAEFHHQIDPSYQ